MADRRTLQKLVTDFTDILNAASERNKDMIRSVREKIQQLDQDKVEVNPSFSYHLIVFYNSS